MHIREFQAIIAEQDAKHFTREIDLGSLALGVGGELGEMITALIENFPVFANLLLLTRSSGIIQEAVKKIVARNHKVDKEEFASEGADVMIYIMCLADKLDLNMEEAVKAKLKINAQRIAEGHYDFRQP